MKITCLLTTLVLLVIINVCSGYDQDDVTSLLNHYRSNHDAGKLRLSNELTNKARLATNTACEKKNIDHHAGTETADASLYGYYSTRGCKDVYSSQLKAIHNWYDECDYYDGQGWTEQNGHFTHMVWKSCKTYGIWAQDCGKVRKQGRRMSMCVVAFKTGQCSTPENQTGSFSSNVGGVGQCFPSEGLRPT